jgi:hypothetical protein
VLYIVLALVLAAFGLLIAALTTANTLWAWLSVIVSVAAAALLVTDWVRGRRKAKAAGVDREPVPVTAPPPPVERMTPVEEDADVFDDDDEFYDDSDDDVEVAVVAEPARAGQAAPTEAAPVDLGEPGEESTDASDLLVVSDLTVEVRVVDEHPRYHLTDCRWLGTRATIPIAVAEARQLGFTPCARCEPDARLAAQHRARAAR